MTAYFEEYSPDEKFDVIIMGFVLEHVDNPDLILERYRHFLKPGGRLYIAVPNAKSLNRRLDLSLALSKTFIALMRMILHLVIKDNTAGIHCDKPLNELVTALHVKKVFT